MQIKFGAGVETAPGVYTREIDLTQTVPAGASTEAGLAGVFAWGPVDEPRLLESENQLVSLFGRPTNDNYETFFTAANYLSYANKLYINRVNDGGLSAVANSGAVVSAAAHTVNNFEDYQEKQGSFEATVDFIARYPGVMGNSLRIAACGSADQFASTVDLSGVSGNVAFTVGSSTATLEVTGDADDATDVTDNLVVGDFLTIGNNTIGTQDVQITTIGAPVVDSGVATVELTLSGPVKIADDFTSTEIDRSWEFKDAVDRAPTTTFSTAQSGNTAAVDGMHVVVVDEDGDFTGRAGSILEVFEEVSRATDAQNVDGVDNYVKNVINSNSSYIWYGTGTSALPTTTGALVESVATTTPYNVSLGSGTDSADESTASIASIAAGMDKFADSALYPLSAFIVGKTRGGVTGEQIFNYAIDNIADVRQDLVVYGSVARTAVVGNTNPLVGHTNFRANVRNTSYASMPSGYKYMYDKYNDTYRHVPLCGDIAGISTRTDIESDPWAAPAGYNRGQIKNIVKLTWNPTAAEQKVLFANDINPVVTTRGEGTHVMGDKTLLGYQSALNAIGTRKMFNILKRSISEASKRLLFEFNDEFTQSRFRNLVEPYLRDIQGRRGITAFRVQCDDENNTTQVKNSNQFVGDMYIQPARSIRTIHLNFVAVNGVPSFTETLV